MWGAAFTITLYDIYMNAYKYKNGTNQNTESTDSLDQGGQTSQVSPAKECY